MRLPCFGRWALPLLLAGPALWANTTVPPPGLREHTPQVHALTGARVVAAPGRVIEGGSVVMRDGTIVAVGQNPNIPPDAFVRDLKGKTVYAGFLDLYSDYGLKAPPAQEPARPRRDAEAVALPGSPYWNPNITPQQSAARAGSAAPDQAEKLRSQGITLVLSVPPGAIMSGTAALIGTGAGEPRDNLIAADVALCIRFGTAQGDTYPGSLMGTLALLRQSFLDADWYTKAHAAWARDPSLPRPEQNEALAYLAAWRRSGKPLLFSTADDLAFLRVPGLAREFGLPALVRGSNQEYRRLEHVKAAGLPVILPLDFPGAPPVMTPEEALGVSLRDLRHWYLAPENARRLHAAGIAIAFTAHGLKDPGDFLKAVRKTVKRGLAPDAALSALTESPARMLGILGRYGTLAPGKAANLVVADGDLFDDETRILETWVDGKRYEVETEADFDLRGSWKLFGLPSRAEGGALTLRLKGKPGRLQGEIHEGVQLKEPLLRGARLSFAFAGDSLGRPGLVRMSAAVESDRMSGHGVWPDGETFIWKAERTAAFAPEAQPPGEGTPEGEARADREAERANKREPLHLAPRYPDGEYGLAQPPPQPRRVAFTNATIWTLGRAGTLEQATLLVEAGRVVRVGRNLKLPAGTEVVDATGRHITPGLVDCHSHTAIDGNVNESNQTISAEVRIGDVVDPDDIAIYRQLAGGLTVANLLHGSANAIGGQNQVIKLRWGGTAEELKFRDAPPGIKFALGENPKQSNWGDRYTSRYPQTRMGVEQIIRDAFEAARRYDEQRAQGGSARRLPQRRDLELEAVAEVLRGKRLVHAHSYRQDEIAMLLRLAEAYGFRIATFQHVLEGYKVADLLARHGAGASSFSDWWAYKFEVYDAIPHNGALMHDQGVLVSFNSDSNELARRLNGEAAKAVKYGGVAPEEALKFVTLNPARQLGIADRVGSLEAGKDADFVLWSGDPLSTYSHCLQTWIDGRKYFDRHEDAARQQEVERERALLIQRVLQESDESEKRPGQTARRPKPEYSCCAVEEGY